MSKPETDESYADMVARHDAMILELARKITEAADKLREVTNAMDAHDETRCTRKAQATLLRAMDLLHDRWDDCEDGMHYTKDMRSHVRYLKEPTERVAAVAPDAAAQ